MIYGRWASPAVVVDIVHNDVGHAAETYAAISY